jgi:hypothetical protein
MYLIIIIERMLLKYYAPQCTYRQKMNSMKLSHYRQLFANMIFYKEVKDSISLIIAVDFDISYIYV